MSDFIPCLEKSLPDSLLVGAAATAVRANPSNHPLVSGLLKFLGFSQEQEDAGDVLTPDRLAVVTTKYWGAKGVKLTVGFPFDSTPNDLQSRILLHMNAWGDAANVKFMLTNGSAHIRITRAQEGYWSYVGTDVLHVPASGPTMCLHGFTMQTPESEFYRVVRHETGHTLGFPHEHMRSELVAKLDKAKTIAYFLKNQGWSPAETMQQVLTPLSEASLMGTPHADQDSIMCYQLPGSITTDGQPIRGGLDINDIDKAFAAKLYPQHVAPPPPPAPPHSGKIRVTVLANADGSFAAVEKIEKAADV